MSKRLANFKIEEDLLANMHMLAKLSNQSTTGFVQSEMEKVVARELKKRGLPKTTWIKWNKIKGTKSRVTIQG
jgi:hypothetical protein